MPGMLFHMMVYAKQGGPPILAILNDLAPIGGCVTWQETHERPQFEKLAAYLIKQGATDLANGMQNHMAVDQAMHGPQSPIYGNMVEVERALDQEDPGQDGRFTPCRPSTCITTKDDTHARLAELIVETSLDGVVVERDFAVFPLIERSQQSLDLERISLLFASFFGRDKELFRGCFDLLKSRNPYATSSMDDLAHSFLAIYDRTLANLALLKPAEQPDSFNECMKLWFTDPRRMELLRRLERRAKVTLREQYETLKNLDFGYRS